MSGNIIRDYIGTILLATVTLFCVFTILSGLPEMALFVIAFFGISPSLIMTVGIIRDYVLGYNCPYCSEKSHSPKLRRKHVKSEHKNISKRDKLALENKWNVSRRDREYTKNIRTLKVGRENELFTITSLLPSGTSTEVEKRNFESEESRDEKLREIFRGAC